MSENRNFRYVVRLTENEAKELEFRMKTAGIGSASAYIRKLVTNGIHLEYDTNEFQKIRRVCSSVANNINQIAIRVNSTSHIYQQEIEEIQEGVNELWQQIQSIQSVLQKLSLSSTS